MRLNLGKEKVNLRETPIMGRKGSKRRRKAVETGNLTKKIGGSWCRRSPRGRAAGGHGRTEVLPLQPSPTGRIAEREGSCKGLAALEWTATCGEGASWRDVRQRRTGDVRRYMTKALSESRSNWSGTEARPYVAERVRRRQRCVSMGAVEAEVGGAGRLGRLSECVAATWVRLVENHACDASWRQKRAIA